MLTYGYINFIYIPYVTCSVGFVVVGLQIRLNGLLERFGVRQPADCKSAGT